MKRFEDKCMPEPMSGCWLWIAGFLHNDYGSFFYEGRNQKASRVAWKIYRGPIPEGLCVLHKCDIRSCVNPDHLWLGTVADNNADTRRKGRAVFMPGDYRGHVKVTDKQIDRLRYLRATTDITLEDLGKQFGLTKGYVGQICRGRVRVRNA